MRIELTRSGGFAGLTTNLGELDTARLPEADAREIEELVGRADVPKLAAASPMHGKGADRYLFELTIEDDDGRRHVAVSEDRVPAELQPLLDRLQRRDSG